MIHKSCYKKLQKGKENMKRENILEENRNKFVKGIIDIGTNSCRLFLAEVEKEREKEDRTISIKRKLYKETQITRLGTFINPDSSIKTEGMDIVINIVKNYRAKADKYGAAELTGFATSATREAANRDIFLKRLYDEAGVEIKCISGEEEANMTFSGAVSEFKNNIILFDIGGGSTEIIFGDRKNIGYLKSFKAGAVRESETFFKNDDYSKIEECKANLKKRLGEISILKEKDFELVGVAGTVTTNVSVKEKMLKYDTDKVHGYRLSKDDLEENLKKYLSVNLEERKKITGLQPQRADTVISGTIIILVIMELLEKNEITVSECDNLEGGMVKI